MKPWQAVAFGVLCTFLVAGIIWLVTRPPRGEEIQLLPPPTSEPLIVHITGAVFKPGVYRLAAGSRVQDAVVAAGGLLPGADPQYTNLAAVLQDGERIVIPTASTPKASPLDARELPPPVTPANIMVDLNTASAAELEKLPGIGPSLAQRIIAYRQEHGLFSTIEEVMNVSGIGPEKYEQIKNQIIVTTLR